MLHACCWPVTGKTLREQAQILIKTHVFVLVHGAAMALYMFLPKNAAIIEVGHPRQLFCCSQKYILYDIHRKTSVHLLSVQQSFCYRVRCKRTAKIPFFPFASP